jgi:ribosomal protein S18 acetylase RimI-like enzyme
MAAYYDGIDHFGHGFMKYHPPKRPGVSQQDFDLYQGVVESAYRFHDMMLDTLLQLAGDDTTVMLISDHGFEPGTLRPDHLPNEPAGPAAEHSPYGIFCLKGTGVKKGERIHGATLLDITPTLLHLYGLPVGRDMDGKVLVNAFAEPQTVSFVDSWDDISGADGRHPPETPGSTSDSVEGLRQLVDLGYIDAPDSDMSKAVDNTVRELQYNLAQACFDGGRITDAAEILALAADPRFQRTGEAARALARFHTAVEGRGAAQVFLEVAAANTGARAFYAAQGYAETGLRRNYYARPAGGRDDAVVMTRALPLRQPPDRSGAAKTG